MSSTEPGGSGPGWAGRPACSHCPLHKGKGRVRRRGDWRKHSGTQDFFLIYRYFLIPFILGEPRRDEGMKDSLDIGLRVSLGGECWGPHYHHQTHASLGLIITATQCISEKYHPLPHYHHKKGGLNRIFYP